MMAQPTITRPATALVVPEQPHISGDKLATDPVARAMLRFADARQLAARTAVLVPVCVYCKRSASTEHTGQRGNRYFTCAECTGPHLNSLAASAAVARFRAERETATGPLAVFLDALLDTFEETGDPVGVCAQLVAALEANRAAKAAA